jgi:RimJ/RimL family protein N-acetyltransferase
MFFRSERLFLRPAWPEDWKAIYQGICDEGIVRMLARAPWPYREEDARDFAVRARGSAGPKFVITLPDESGAPLIGMIGIEPREGFDHEMGYWIARSHWGHGFATEAGNAVLGVARSIGLKRILAGHFLDNPASGRVLEKLGFHPTGEVLREFSLGRGDHAPSRRMAIALDEADGEDDVMVQMPAAA